jgi:hypothetical protein
MHVIESIGPLLGIVAFAGLAVLAFLLFQQARDIRRLREWAGRAPERAQEAAEAVQATAEASRSELQDATAAPAATHGLRERVGAAWTRVKGATAPRLRAVDRRLPIDGRYLLAIVALALVAVGVLTSGFGLVGGSEDNGHRKGGSPKPTVAVLNGTSVTGLADRVDKQVVGAAGYKTGHVTNTASTFTNTVIMYTPGHRSEAEALAIAVKPKLGKTTLEPIASDVKARAGSAPLALTLGLDDSRFGSG